MKDLDSYNRNRNKYDELFHCKETNLFESSLKSFTLKEQSFWLNKKEGRFFDDHQFNKAEAKFRKMAETDVVDWYITGSNDTMVKVTLVNYKRGD